GVGVGQRLAHRLHGAGSLVMGCGQHIGALVAQQAMPFAGGNNQPPVAMRQVHVSSFRCGGGPLWHQPKEVLDGASVRALSFGLQSLRGQVMEMYVEPAKRPGRRKLIRKSPLMPTAITHDIEGIRLIFEAQGIYDASTYRYT